MTTKTITFLGTPYTADLAVSQGGIQPLPLSGMNMGQLLSLHNLIASNLGQGSVKRFADVTKARTRTWAKLTEYQAVLDAEDAEAAQHDDLTDDPEMAAYEAKGVTGAAGVACPGAVGQPALAKASDQLINALAAKADAAKAAPAAAKAPATRWRRPKHEDASKVAYRPAEGSIQHVLYTLLNQPQGITMEDFCAAVQKTGTKDATLFTPAAVWGAMRYLLVTNRGYGLDWNGTHLKLLVPADERLTPAKGKAAQKAGA